MAERKIGDETYKFEKLPALGGGLIIMGRVAKMLGPAWGYIDRIFDEDEAKRDSAALMMIMSVVKDLDVQELVGFLTELCSLCQIRLNGAYEPVQPKFHLQSEVEVFKVALFVLEVQCKDFFGAASGNKVGSAILGSATRLSAV